MKYFVLAVYKPNNKKRHYPIFHKLLCFVFSTIFYLKYKRVHQNLQVLIDWDHGVQIRVQYELDAKTPTLAYGLSSPVNMITFFCFQMMNANV